MEIGGNASTIIVFHNPFDCGVLVDVCLKQKMADGEFAPVLDNECEFNLLLKVWTNLLLPSKAIIDIPISYAPDLMNKHEAVCIITTRPMVDGVPDETSGEVCWTYNIQVILGLWLFYRL